MAPGAQRRGDAGGEEALELSWVGEPVGVHHGARVPAALPLGGRALVAADVHGAPREEAGDVAGDLLGEGERVLADVEHVLGDPPARPDLDGVARRRAPGTPRAPPGRGRAGRSRARRSTKRRARVVADLREVASAVEAAVRNMVIDAVRLVAHRRRGAPRPDRREPRPARHLHAPALVVVEVQVQPVQPVHRRQVDQAADVGDGEEVARDVQVHAAPVPRRPVFDQRAGQARRRSVPAVLDQLGQGAQGVGGARRPAGRDDDGRVHAAAGTPRRRGPGPARRSGQRRRARRRPPARHRG